MRSGRKVVIIGSGFSSLSAACFLAKEGYEIPKKPFLKAAIRELHNKHRY